MRRHLLKKLVEQHHKKPPVRIIDWSSGVATVHAGETAVGIPFRAGPASMLSRDLRFFLQRSPLPSAEPGDYAEYFVEDKPEAGVVLRRKDGTLIAHIPIDVWDHAQTMRLDSDRPNISLSPR